MGARELIESAVTDLLPGLLSLVAMALAAAVGLAVVSYGWRLVKWIVWGEGKHGTVAIRPWDR